jgi:hypothetical protein
MIPQECGSGNDATIKIMLEAPIMDPCSRPDGEPQDEMSLFTSHGREEVLTTITGVWKGQ